jgi:hypothetical protein
VAERLLMATASRETDAVLRIVTDDGDVVSISAHQEASATYVDWGRRARTDAGTSVGRLRIVDLRSQRSFTIEVQGELDAEEREDLLQLIGRVAGSLQQFVRGNMTAAAARLQGGDLGSLDSFEAHFERTVSVTVAEWVRRRELGNAAPAGAPAPEPIPDFKPAQDETLAPAPMSEDTERYAESLADAARRSTVAFDHVVRAIRRLFDRLELEGNAPEARAIEDVRSAFERLVERSEVAPPSTQP